MQPEVPFNVEDLRARVRSIGGAHWRDLPWRHTRDPYRIWISEVMLQQTQVARVEARWPAWLEEFPTVETLAQADDARVLAAWQGMGYNRRALALHRAAQAVAGDYGGVFPREADRLQALPGVGPATAAGIRAFAFDEPGVYLETNVRAVFIHELFPTASSVPDAALVPLVREACPQTDVRGWYYACLDYGAWLKQAGPNPTRRARAYTRQPRFEGSHRQKRAFVLRCLLGQEELEPVDGPGTAHTAAPDTTAGAASSDVTAGQVAQALDRAELRAGRQALGLAATCALLAELQREGFCYEIDGFWHAGSRPV